MAPMFQLLSAVTQQHSSQSASVLPELTANHVGYGLPRVFLCLLNVLLDRVSKNFTFQDLQSRF